MLETLQLSMTPAELLRAPLTSFLAALEAATVPCPHGREVTNPSSAIVLSRAVARLMNATHAAVDVLMATCSVETTLASTRDVEVQMSDSPDGPFETIDPSSIRLRIVDMAKAGSPAAAAAAIEQTAISTGWPTDRWNRQQAAAPGGDHMRFSQGDVITARDVDLLRSAALLLELPVNTPSGSPAAAAPSPCSLSESERAIVDRLAQTRKRISGRQLQVDALGRESSYGRHLLSNLCKRGVIIHFGRSARGGSGYELPRIE